MSIETSEVFKVDFRPNSPYHRCFLAHLKPPRSFSDKLLAHHQRQIDKIATILSASFHRTNITSRPLGTWDAALVFV